MSSLHKNALLPWWVLQLATGAKSFVDNPVIGSPRLNEAGLHVQRLKLAHRMAWWRRRRLAHLVSAEDRAAFARDGFVLKPDFLPADQFERLRSGIFDYAAPAREMVQGDAVTRRIALDPALLSAIPEARALLRDPRWRGLLRYVGASNSEPLSYVQTILARKFEAPADPQLTLHSDTFQPTVKAWLFLTDVAEDEGPFVYVPGSHLLTPKRLDWEWKQSIVARDAERLTARGSFRIERDALDALGLPGPKSFAVPANTLIVADTSGFHARGASTQATTRVEIWAYGRRNPFLPWTGFDIGSLPGLAERRIAFHWKLHDRYSRWLGQPWRDVGRKRPGDA